MRGSLAPSLIDAAVHVPWDTVLLVSLGLAVIGMLGLLLWSLRGHDEPD